MCFSQPKMPAVTMPKLPAPVMPPTQRDATIDANAERQRRRRRVEASTDGTGGLGDSSLAPVTKSTLGG